MTPLEEINEKRLRLSDFLAQHGLDMVLLSRRANFAWLTAGCSNHVSQASDVGTATLVATRDVIRCVANCIESPRMQTEELQDRRIEVITYPWYDEAAASAVWAEVVGRQRAAADSLLPGMPGHVTLLPPAFSQLRWKLCRAERRRYRALGAAVGAGLQEVCRQIEPGQSEHEVGAALAARLHREGIRTPVILVAADERIDRFRHPIPTERRVTRRVMVVVAGERDGLISSATRLVVFGALPSGLRRKHDAVVRVDAALMAATTPGRPLCEVFAEGRRAYADAGFADEWKLHHQGGPTGYAGRELRATATTTMPVLADQAFAWNPSITGTKSEDTILVRADKVEVLTQAVDWPMIEVDVGGTTWRRPDILVRDA